MRRIKIGRHTVEYYDSIDTLPVIRFHKFQKMMLVDSGVGGDIESFDRHMERIKRYFAKGNTENALREIDNVRQCVWMIQNGLRPSHLAFAALVVSIDGCVCDDLTDDALRELANKLGDVLENELDSAVLAAKKKMSDDLTLYYPNLFEDGDTKEYYDRIRERTLKVLNGIVNGSDNPLEDGDVERLTDEIICWTKPDTFVGADGAEIRFDKRFENMCVILTKETGRNAKDMTVMEFYTAFDYVKNKAKHCKR